ncbi:MAG: Gfo/Idh/MocA family oxidoreductase [Terriglobia bacterium]|jgi:predicted dehydrogenase
MANNQMNRRQFISTSAGVAALGAASKAALLSPRPLEAAPRAVPPSDRVRFASIGTGVEGCTILQAALACPGTEIVAACDLYDGRLTAAREYARKDIFTTKDYRAILDRKDVDAVLVATPDHWHAQITQDACAAGKDVYCEKPMSHTVDQAFAMIDAMQKYNRIVQVGSQCRSSIVYAKAKEIFSSGALGQVTAVEASIDRNDASGAWVYPIPPDASEKTIDWDRFLGDAPKRPFDPIRFFRWRCFRDYGEGLPGDLYVHMLTGIHHITGTNAPPLRAASMGGIFRWTENREAPDLIWTLFEYPSFRLSLRCNLNNESPGMECYYGTKGTMEIKDEVLTVTPQPTEPQPEGYSIIGWPEKLRGEYLDNWRKEHPAPLPGKYALHKYAESFQAPPGYDYQVDHMNNFLESVRTRQPSVEDAVYGKNTAIACHMANHSYFNKTLAVWNESARKIQGA